MIQRASAENNYHYNKALQSYANILRKDMTKAEACAWKYLFKGRQLGGYQFRRQRPILNYIVDFVCNELMLIVEIDGITHRNEESVIKEADRDEVLDSIGFTVLRFTDWEILNRMTDVSQVITSWIEKRKGG